MFTASKFLKENSNIREELLHLKLSFELKRAAAEREYHLKVFRTNVDFEGFDIIIDDNQIIGKYQVKSKWTSKTSSWRIQRNILFPTRRDAEKMRVGDGVMCSNTQKGVILLDISGIEIENNFKLNYYYTDFYIIKAISHKLIPSSRQAVISANKVLVKLLGERKSPNEKIVVTKNLFIKLKDSRGLLAICGFDNSININPRIIFLRLFENNKANSQGIMSGPQFEADSCILQQELSQILE